MRSTTRVWMGLNNVGDKKDAPVFHDGSFIESITFLATWLGQRSMATRIDVVFARSQEEAQNALRIRQQGDNGIDVSEDLMTNLQSLMDAAESNQETA